MPRPATACGPSDPCYLEPVNTGVLGWAYLISLVSGRLSVRYLRPEGFLSPGGYSHPAASPPPASPCRHPDLFSFPFLLPPPSNLASRAPCPLHRYGRKVGQSGQTPFPAMAYLSMGEAHRRITDYLSRFCDAVSSQDAATLSALLAISSNFASLQAPADALNVFQDSNQLVNQAERYAQFAEILSPLLRCLQSYRLGRYADAYVAFEKAANAFLQEFRNWETAWAMEAVYILALEIRLLAEKADRELSSSGKNTEKLQGAGSFLMKVFGALAGKGPKRVGALYVACQLFKVYFKLGTVHLCRSVIRSIETARIFDLDEFPVKDKVTYMYYTGRLEVYNENFIVADQKLTYALTHCSPNKEANKRMILKYLIPVKLSIGILPKQWLLEKYSLMEYNEVVKALKTGDLRLLRRALREHEDRFLRSGVYLVLEKLELQVYQRLIKKIYVLQKQKDPSKAHQLKMEVAVKALNWLGMDMDIDEAECIMAILIFKNLTKGYISHKNKVVVLSKQDPFPKLNGKPVSS